MDSGDESQSSALPRPLTSIELEVIDELDALDATEIVEDTPEPVPAAVPAAPHVSRPFIAAARQFKTRLDANREVSLDKKRKDDRAAYADLIMSAEGRAVRSYQARTPERQREIELAKYRAKPTSDQSAKRAARRRKAKEAKVEAERPEHFGKF